MARPRWVVLVAATTENPSFSVIAPLLSRSLLLTLRPLQDAHIEGLLARAVEDERGLNSAVVLSEAARDYLVRMAGGGIFASGMREYHKLRERHIADAGTLLDGARRAMRASFQRELDAVESNLSFLASVGSVSPYVGLFGTVWGIMRSFTGIAQAQNTSLAVVAPGIAEALFATAIGLFAAIPAVIAYNRYSHRINQVEARLNRFADAFHATLSRQLEGVD